MSINLNSSYINLFLNECLLLLTREKNVVYTNATYNLDCIF